MKTSKPIRPFLSSLPLALALTLASCATPAQKVAPVKEPTLPMSWVQIGPNSEVIARTITRQPNCPAIQLDGSSQEMSLRTTPSSEFPVTVCEASIPASARSAVILGKSLALPKKNPSRILVIGDTGCRIKTGKWGRDIQDCNSPDAWPFERIAKSAASLKPDLVIHVGDYLYRESPCPSGEPKCANSPIGDNWESWTADFFTPGEELITSAPWIYVRGNHELCTRGGQGWFHFLDPRAYSSICSDATPPYFVQVGNSQFVILDSALADDQKPKEKTVQVFTEQFKAIQKFPITQGMLFTHKPFWGIAESEVDTQHPLYHMNETLQLTSKNLLPKGIHTIVAGHIHAFEVLQFSDSGPTQIVIGNSGTKLSPIPTLPFLKDVEVGGRKIQNRVSVAGFGFMTMEKAKNGSWKIQQHSVQGTPQKTCTMSTLPGRKVTCKEEQVK